ncbi:Phospho-N-acetylmuramoyl-pentapeptide-transferase [Peptoclostridium litorale DSM 5388]|uniref:Phospho-N-acetylmuramoyl-pentapeptide-transferase n=1 Tax=Peptoclostridium litorale DSM 5388 TaxID=1121324 RepID=A0A069RD83_PEPLI|nr:phospho-N-acetylmuramoyl-pentapeptide-transferase [Peptoclostridium litorale]KDR95019.1 phospho-N-acetylmuramoyl-pentapeptide-transferase MraY [Peptoclostridium litorale DSM 5388]SIN76398.1 Phospho-N-acetylmuramoyl-pentapeptide-transferase [Peptoclostridium litorale DSM 5388]
MFNYHMVLIPAVVALAATLISGPMLIPVLKRLKFGQTIRDEGPKTHLVKNGTPTMGGIILVIGIIVASLLSGKVDGNMLVALFSIIGFGLVGFVDDYIKVVLKRSLGLRAYQKLIGQFVFAFLIVLYQYKTSDYGSSILVPFTDGYYFDMGMLYIPFTVLVVVATVNSVNLTDGLDGLASGVTLIVSVFFVITASMLGYESIAIVCSAVFGACLGFLRFNIYPAKVFMGDTGSMALGGAVAAAAVIMNASLMIPIVGGIYFAESLSVIIQVTSFKLTGKRVFKMSPIHHHFELVGWHETKVVGVFWATSLVLGAVALIAFI